MNGLSTTTTWRGPRSGRHQRRLCLFQVETRQVTEHGQWLRDQQVAAYAGLIDSVKAATLWANDAYKIESEQTRHEEGLKIMGSLKSGHLVMLAPDATLKAADDMITSLYDFVQEVSTHGYPTGSPQFRALFDDFGAKQSIFNGRCRTDFRTPK